MVDPLSPVTPSPQPSTSEPSRYSFLVIPQPATVLTASEVPGWVFITVVAHEYRQLGKLSPWKVRTPKTGIGQRSGSRRHNVESVGGLLISDELPQD